MSGFDYEQFKQLANSVKDLNKDFDTFLNDFLLREGMRCLANTKRRTPVDMGTLRNRWKLSGPFKNGNTKYVVIHNNLNYASFVEDGHMQRERFLPIKYLEKSPGGTEIVNYLKQKYGSDIKGVKLKNKWIPGKHMARIALTQTQNKMDARFEQAFVDFCKGKGLG